MSCRKDDDRAFKIRNFLDCESDKLTIHSKKYMHIHRYFLASFPTSMKEDNVGGPVRVTTEKERVLQAEQNSKGFSSADISAIDELRM